MPNVSQGDPIVAAANTRLYCNVSIGLLVQTDGALLFKLQQPPFNVEVPLEGGVLLLDHPPQGVYLGVGRLEGLLDGHQGAIKSKNNNSTKKHPVS